MLELFEIIRQIAMIPGLSGNEEGVRRFIKSWVQREVPGLPIEEDATGNIFCGKGALKLCAHMDKKNDPHFTENEHEIIGKLDDAVGVGIILYLLKEFKRGFKALFTVGEEVGHYGAREIVTAKKFMAQSKVIVIDTSPFGESFKGPLIYQKVGAQIMDPLLIRLLEQIASEENIPVQYADAKSNDAIEFAAVGIPTVALEPHLENYHTSKERIAKADVIATYWILAQLIRTLLDIHSPQTNDV